MKLFDLTVGLIGITLCTIVQLIASILMYVATFGMVLYLAMRRKTKFKKGVKKINTMFSNNIKAYCQNFIGA